MEEKSLTVGDMINVGRPPGRRKQEPNQSTKVSLPKEIREWLDSMGGLRLFITCSYALYLRDKERCK